MGSRVRAWIVPPPYDVVPVEEPMSVAAAPAYAAERTPLATPTLTPPAPETLLEFVPDSEGHEFPTLEVVRDLHHKLRVGCTLLGAWSLAVVALVVSFSLFSFGLGLQVAAEVVIAFGAGSVLAFAVVLHPPSTVIRRALRWRGLE